MSPQQKLSRIFKLIRYLAQKPAKTIPQLAEWLETDKRTVYRYLRLLEEIGYLIDMPITLNRTTLELKRDKLS